MWVLTAQSIQSDFKELEKSIKKGFYSFLKISEFIFLKFHSNFKDVNSNFSLK